MKSNKSDHSVATEAAPLKYKAMHDNIIVRRVSAEKMTKGGIALPDVAQGKPNKGVVLSVGPGRPNAYNGDMVPMVAKVGMTVLFGKYSGNEVMEDNEEIVFLRDMDILAIEE